MPSSVASESDGSAHAPLRHIARACFCECVIEALERGARLLERNLQGDSDCSESNGKKGQSQHPQNGHGSVGDVLLLSASA